MFAEALRGMEAVAEHINEMQKIYEEYGSIFDDLVKCSKDTYKNLDLNVGELQMYGTVTWLNALDELGKIKKGVELLSTVFVFKAGVVLLVQERVKGKKKPKVGSVNLNFQIYKLFLQCQKGVWPMGIRIFPLTPFWQ